MPEIIAGGRKTDGPVVCVLAHNEESNIERTLRSIIDGNADTRPLIKVYANGCTDKTHQVVRGMIRECPQIELIEIAVPSKPNAWNQAFRENSNRILIFADADVLPSPGAVREIIEQFERYPDLEVVSCESWPDYQAVGWEQRFTGFLQIPLVQDFLIGHFYGLHRAAFLQHFTRLGLEGLPSGIAGEDAFLEGMMTPGKFKLADARVRYEPPMLVDYYNYLGRIQWQNEQIALFNQSSRVKVAGSGQRGGVRRLKQKLAAHPKGVRLFSGISATVMRLLFKRLMSRKISQAYRALGPVTQDGAWVLSEATRSASCK